MPSVRERLASVGVTVAPPERRSPEYLGRFMRREVEKWAGPIKASGVSMRRCSRRHKASGLRWCIIIDWG
jgi:hypothetical protein